MYKPNISFKSKKWVCNQCGLLKEISKREFEIGDEVFFKINYADNNLKYLEQVIHGIVLDIHNTYLTVLEKTTIQTYFTRKDDAYLKSPPAHFLYNMYGQCMCKKSLY